MQFRNIVTLVLYFIIALAIGVLVFKNYDFDMEEIKDSSVLMISEVKQGIETVVIQSSENKTTVIDDEIKETEAGTDPHNYFVDDGYKNNFRVMLQNGEFSKLNRVLNKLQNDMYEDITKEAQLYLAYESFEIKNADYEALFNNWVLATPDKYQPYLARASYYYEMSWLSRGHKYMSRTSDKSVNQMYDYFKLAMKDISVVMEKNKKTTVPHYLLIGMSGMSGADQERQEVFDKALSVNPLSYELRVKYLNFITPRWGGSLKQMASVIKAAEKYMPDNSRLEALSGLAFSEAGETEALKKNYKKAETYFNKALSIAENHDTLFERGKARNYLNDYQAAIKDLSRAIELRSEISRYYYWRARSYNALKEYQKAAIDIKKARSLDPFDSYVHSHINWMTKRLVHEGYQFNSNQKFKQAVDKYTLALDLSPQIAINYDRRSRAYVGLHKMEEALVDIKTAIRLDPAEIRYYSLLDYLLAKSKQWDEIIRYWDAFIKLKPKNGRAYLERGGSYYHKGDIEAAIADAKKSSELGNLEGREMYQRFKHRAQ